tara:strand:- start:1705 stop:1950 length:246 start_codon:yes stop_codon:yes gene_type:complete
MKLGNVKAKFTALLELDSNDIDVLSQLSYHNGPVSEVLNNYHIKDGVTPKKAKEVLSKLALVLSGIKEIKESIKKIHVVVE